MAPRKPRKPKRSSGSRAGRLTPQQRLFVAFYLQKQNGAWAARKAGYEEENARYTARDLLTNPHIKRAIREGFEGLLEEQRLEAGRILREQARLAFSDLTNVVNWDKEGQARWEASEDLEPDVSATVAEFTEKRTIIRSKDGGEIERIERKIKLHPKQPALDKLMAYRQLAGSSADGEGALDAGEGPPNRFVVVDPGDPAAGADAPVEPGIGPHGE